MRIVIDTNVFLSALMSPASVSAEILVLWRARRFELLTAQEQFEEIARVTRYPRIRARLAPAAAGRFVNRLRDLATFVTRLPKVDVCPDPDDNYLLAIAERGKAQMLITGDHDLLALRRHKSTHIVKTAEFIALLRD
jgi:uncharacterized protein